MKKQIIINTKLAFHNNTRAPLEVQKNPKQTSTIMFQQLEIQIMSYTPVPKRNTKLSTSSIHYQTEPKSLLSGDDHIKNK